MSVEPWLSRVLIGRDRELGVLTGRVGAVRERGGAVLVSGEPGVGKSALLEAVADVARARDVRVLSVQGAPSEANLPFAGLHQLLHPVLGRAERRPAALAWALRSAPGRPDEEAPSLHLVALDTLHLLCDCASRAPLLLLVDDAHWLDQASGDVLAFVARRLEADAVLLVAAVREGHETPLLEAVPDRLAVERLSDAEAAALLGVVAPELTTVLREWVLREALGNPLALVELPVALRSAELDEATLLPHWMPVTARLERAFTGRVRELPPVARTMLRVAAADEGAPLDRVLRAASDIHGRPVTVDGAAAAVTAGLIDTDGSRIRFRHPLVRSAIYDGMTLPERTTVHTALAGTLGRDPDRAAWHAAAAVVGSDEAVAVALRESAERALRRGAVGLGLRALERAAQISSDPAHQGECLIHAAELGYQLGRPADVGRLLQAARRLELPPAQRSRVAWLSAFFRESWSGTATMSELIASASQLRLAGERDRALDALVMLAMRCWFDNPSPETRDPLIAALAQIDGADDDPRRLAVLGLASPEEHGPVIVDRLRRLPADWTASPESSYLLGLAGSCVGAFADAERRLDAAAAALRAQGRLGLLAQTLLAQAWAEIHRGKFLSASIAAAEASRLAEEHGQPLRVAVAQLAEATAMAYRGDVDRAAALAAAGEQVLLPAGANPMLSMVAFARGAAALAGGRPVEAYEQLRCIFDAREVAYHRNSRCWVLVDLVEAAVQSGHQAEARSIVAELEPAAHGSGWPLFRAALDYARPVLADDGNAEEEYARSLGARLADWPFTRARLQLAFGVWLRRQRRTAESRAPLRAARDAFFALGAAPWAERADRELRASGESNRSRTPAASAQLSPQELQIARMAAEGLSNKEIGRQLFLSPRTVASHLYRVFPKLQITRRTQLRRALSSMD